MNEQGVGIRLMPSKKSWLCSGGADADAHRWLGGVLSCTVCVLSRSRNGDMPGGDGSGGACYTLRH
jgi:hypothetical protein